MANTFVKTSSTLNRFHKPGYGRLNTAIEGGAWCAHNTNTSQYFQVDLHEVHKITNIMLQGKYSGPPEEQGWVTKFSVTYSNDGIVWSQHVEEGLMVSGISFLLFCSVVVVVRRRNRQLFSAPSRRASRIISLQLNQENITS